ncbi:MAG: aryl-sulfate sulfotransferase, partial [bacterium]
MKRAIIICVLLANTALAYEAFQGPTELLYWDKTQTCDGYTFFGVRGTSYLVDMEGRVVHTWPVGTNPHLLDNGNVLDASADDPSGFGGFKEVDWNGLSVWSYTEARSNYIPHHDFVRIFNPKLGTNTTLYIANKSVSYSECIAVGCNPASGPYTNGQMDAIVEVDMTGNIVWEWAFFDHLVQNYDVSKSNYVTSISNYPGRLDVNLPGRPVQRDWLH